MQRYDCSKGCDLRVIRWDNSDISLWPWGFREKGTPFLQCRKNTYQMRVLIPVSGLGGYGEKDLAYISYFVIVVAKYLLEMKEEDLFWLMDLLGPVRTYFSPS